MIFGLPPAAAATIENLFGGASYGRTRRRVSRGAALCEVGCQHKGNDVTVKIHPDGTLVRAETCLPQEDLPPPVGAVMAKAAKTARVSKIIKSESFAEAKLVKLDSPRVLYEATVLIGLIWRRIRVAADGSVIPRQEGRTSRLSPRAEAAAREAFPDATFAGVRRDYEGGMTLYEAQLRQNGKKTVVRVAGDGSLLRVDTKSAMGDLPAAVANVIAAFTRFGLLMKLQKVEVSASVEAVALRDPRVIYEAEIRRPFRKTAIRVAADGTVVEKWDRW